MPSGEALSCWGMMFITGNGETMTPGRGSSRQWDSASQRAPSIHRPWMNTPLLAGAASPSGVASRVTDTPSVKSSMAME